MQYLKYQIQFLSVAGVIYSRNITPSAEYNFFVDPEAAKIVLHSGIPMTMVGWEMCTQYSIMDDNNHHEIEALATSGSQFFKYLIKL